MLGQVALALLFRRSWIGRLVDWSDDPGDWGMLAPSWFFVLILSALGLLGSWAGHLLGVR